jgi:isopentenyl diphosphate isomerase/L-lactate dehydrogenase-like FMN-dependent dehydrogenase
MKDIRHSALNIFDLRDAARRRLPRGVFEFIDRGCEDDVAIRNNRAALERIKLRPRVLVDVSERKTATTLFGQPQAMPLVIAPTGPTGLMWYRGEVELARAAADAGIPFTLASPATTAMEDVMAEGGGRQWFQLYMWRDREMSYQILDRAKAAGFEALVVTVDSIVPPNREFHVRDGFTIPFTLNARNIIDLAGHPRWLFGVAGTYWMRGGLPQPRNYTRVQEAKIPVRPLGRSIDKNQSLTWNDLRTLRDKWPRTLIVKGILNVQDAVMAAECGADGIVVSNHGGICCDSAVAPIDALSPVVAAVGARLTVLVDSGFRRGSDVVKALALGAKAVLIGRATLYGTAAAGEAGAARALEILRTEIDRMLAVLGCRSIHDLRRDHVILPSEAVYAASGDGLVSRTTVGV